MKKLSLNKLPFTLDKKRLFGARTELERDWSILLGFFTLAVVSWVVIGVWVLLRIHTQEIFVEEESFSLSLDQDISYATLSSLLEELETRDIQFEAVRRSSTIPQNPVQ